MDILERIQETELLLKQAELKIKEKELSASPSLLSRFRISAAEATLFVGALAFFGTFFGTYTQESNKIELMQREHESALILDALKEGDTEQNLAKLTFLIDAGFIVDQKGKIRSLILSGKYGDTISPPSSPRLIDALAKGSAPLLLREILEASGASPDIDLRGETGVTGIALISIQKNGRIQLIYDKERISGFNKENANSWTVPAILAHEIGHVILGHGRCDGDCAPLQITELEADEFAGRILRRLGASRIQVQKAYEILPDVPAPDYPDMTIHPVRAKRIEAITEGWDRK